MRVIVVTFDRLPARLLACYGNEWIETPEFDQLASHSSVFEQNFVESPGSAGPNHPWWTGRREFFERASESSEGDVVSRLVRSGVACRLLAESIEGLPTESFSSHQKVDFKDGLEIDHSETGFARLVQQALEVSAEKSGEPELLWLHSRGVPSPWLPPRVFADLYLNELEEDEPEEEWDENTGKPLDEVAPIETSGETVEPPASFDILGVLDEISENPTLIEALLSDTELSEEDFDLEHPLQTSHLERLISRFIFAGYVSLIDHWLGRLVQGLTKQCQNNSAETILIVTAASGKEFGDRAAFTGAPADSTEICDELLQTPLLIHQVGNRDFGERIRRLTGPANLAPTLAALLKSKLKQVPAMF